MVYRFRNTKNTTYESKNTIQIAKDVANKLTESHFENYKKKSEELKKSATEVYLKTVPDTIKQLSKKDYQYIKKIKHVSCIGNGFDHDSFDIEESPAKESYQATFEPNKDDSKILQKLRKEAEQLKDNYRQLNSEIEAALLNLRTYSKVEKEFPEAFKMLPNSIPTSLAININDIRAKL